MDASQGSTEGRCTDLFERVNMEREGNGGWCHLKYIVTCSGSGFFFRVMFLHALLLLLAPAGNALHAAVLQDRPDEVRRLVKAGEAAADAADADGNTPLHLAARSGAEACAEALLRPPREAREQGGPAAALPAKLVNLQNRAGETCAHLAAKGGHGEVLRLLLWNGANVEAADGRRGRTALHFAAESGDEATVRALAQPRPLGCGANAASRDGEGRTPCQLALLGGHGDVADFLARVATGDQGASAADLFPAEANAATAAAAAAD